MAWQTDNQPEQVSMQATAYCLKGKTATGGYTRQGICSSSRNHFGDVAQVYKRNKDGSLGEFLFYLECTDCGGSSISSGRVLDVWLGSYSEAKAFGRKDIIVIWTNGKG